MLDRRVCGCLFTFAQITQQPEMRVTHVTFQVVDDISISFPESSLSIMGTAQRERETVENFRFQSTVKSSFVSRNNSDLHGDG